MNLIDALLMSATVFFLIVIVLLGAVADKVDEIYKHLGLDKPSQPSTSKEK